MKTREELERLSEIKREELQATVNILNSLLDNPNEDPSLLLKHASTISALAQQYTDFMWILSC